MSDEVAKIAFQGAEQFRVDFVKKHVRTGDNAIALATMLIYEGILMLKTVGGSKYAAQVLYDTADEMATREDSA